MAAIIKRPSPHPKSKKMSEDVSDSKSRAVDCAVAWVGLYGAKRLLLLSLWVVLSSLDDVSVVCCVVLLIVHKVVFI